MALIVILITEQDTTVLYQEHSPLHLHSGSGTDIGRDSKPHSSSMPCHTNYYLDLCIIQKEPDILLSTSSDDPIAQHEVQTGVVDSQQTGQ